MKIIQIIPAPSGSFFVVGPYGSKPEMHYYVEAACVLALVDHDGEQTIVPIGFGDDLDPVTDSTRTLFANSKDAHAAAMRWTATMNK
jgi:hypothetical protein